MNISTDRKIVTAAKALIELYTKHGGGEGFWDKVRQGAEYGDILCKHLIVIYDAVRANHKRNIVSTSKNLISMLNKHGGEAFWREIREYARQGDPICQAYLDLKEATGM